MGNNNCECGRDVFEEGKCILHCDKSGWDELEEVRGNKIRQFWDEIKNKIITLNNSFNKKLAKAKEEDGEELYEYNFYKVRFPCSNESDGFYNLNTNINISFQKCHFLGEIDFKSLFKAKGVTFNECIFYENVEFKNRDFNLFLFQNCKVYKNIKFQEISFKETASFMNTKFYKDVEFINCRFGNLALFNDMKANKFILDNTFFESEANFLDIKVDDLDRETARIIKHSFEKQDNIIEANRFYAFEMKKKEEELFYELTIKCKSLREFFFIDLPEYVVFLIHKISSNHSQSFLLPIFWILIITCIFYNDIVLYSFNEPTKNHLICMLDNIANKINPFSIMTIESISFYELIFKSIIAYLIYQFIISIRQNTRRK